MAKPTSGARSCAPSSLFTSRRFHELTLDEVAQAAAVGRHDLPLFPRQGRSVLPDGHCGLRRLVRAVAAHVAWRRAVRAAPDRRSRAHQRLLRTAPRDPADDAIGRIGRALERRPVARAVAQRREPGWPASPTSSARAWPRARRALRHPLRKLSGLLCCSECCGRGRTTDSKRPARRSATRRSSSQPFCQRGRAPEPAPRRTNAIIAAPRRRRGRQTANRKEAG